MEIKINRDGCLEIKRGKEYKKATCPFDVPDDITARCGDWCALFGEPEPKNPNIVDENESNMAYLELCHTTLYASAIIDERE